MDRLSLLDRFIAASKRGILDAGSHLQVLVVSEQDLILRDERLSVYLSRSLAEEFGLVSVHLLL